MALEHYLHALTSEQIEIKFESASTALECILTKYFDNEEQKSKIMTFTKEEFKQLKKIMIPFITQFCYNIEKKAKNGKELLQFLEGKLSE